MLKTPHFTPSSSKSLPRPELSLSRLRRQQECLRSTSPSPESALTSPYPVYATRLSKTPPHQFTVSTSESLFSVRTEYRKTSEVHFPSPDYFNTFSLPSSLHLTTSTSSVSTSKSLSCPEPSFCRPHRQQECLRSTFPLPNSALTLSLYSLLHTPPRNPSTTTTSSQSPFLSLLRVLSLSFSYRTNNWNA